MGRPWQAPWQGAAGGAGAAAAAACGASRVRAGNLAADLRQRGRADGPGPSAAPCMWRQPRWCESTAACGSRVWYWAWAPALQCVVAMARSCAETLACWGLSESRALKRQHSSALVSSVVPLSRSSPCCHMHNSVQSMPLIGREHAAVAGRGECQALIPQHACQHMCPAQVDEHPQGGCLEVLDCGA